MKELLKPFDQERWFQIGSGEIKVAVKFLLSELLKPLLLFNLCVTSLIGQKHFSIESKLIHQLKIVMVIRIIKGVNNWRLDFETDNWNFSCISFPNDWKILWKWWEWWQRGGFKFNYQRSLCSIIRYDDNSGCEDEFHFLLNF